MTKLQEAILPARSLLHHIRKKQRAAQATDPFDMEDPSGNDRLRRIFNSDGGVSYKLYYWFYVDTSH